MAPSRTLVLHVGEPKTGTTSIQQFLHLNASGPGPQDDSGLWYLPRINNGKAHHALAHVLRTTSAEDVFARTLGPIADAPAGSCGVVSGEGLSHFTPDQVAAAVPKSLRQNADLAIWVLIYIRPHIGRLLSLYQQQIKAGQTVADLADYARAKIASDQLRTTENVIARYRELFEGRVIVRPFVSSELKNGDAVADVLDVLTPFLRTPVTPPVDAILANPSQSVPTLALMRHAWDALGGRNARVETKLMRGFVRRVTKKLEAPAKGKLVIGRKLMTALQDHFHDEAKRIDDILFERPIFTTALETTKPARRTSSLKLHRHFSNTERRVIHRQTRRLLKRSEAMDR